LPTYQYACTECGHGFEAVQSFSDDALTECPQCTGRLRKVFSSVGIVFKGSGFYRTDSREKAGAADGNGAKDSAAAKADGKTADGKKGDAKAASGPGGSGSAGSSSGTSTASSGSSSSSSPSGSSTSGTAA
jgi:putative FmdB family regulatory protein